MTVSPPQSLAIQAIVRAGEKLLEQGYETEDTDPASAFECFFRAAEYLQGGSGLIQDWLALALYHGLEGGTGQEGSESSAMGLSRL